jgi:hypothetical protein
MSLPFLHNEYFKVSERYGKNRLFEFCRTQGPFEDHFLTGMYRTLDRAAERFISIEYFSPTMPFPKFYHKMPGRPIKPNSYDISRFASIQQENSSILYG